MFSTIGNIITGQQKPRETETSDTRLDIHRHDPDAERRKNESDDENVNALLNEDDAEVSIEALYIFLENFLQSQIDKAKQGEATKTELPDAPQERQPAAEPKGKAAVAINAYTQAAEVTQTKSIMDNSTPSPQEMDIDSEEVRMIHALLSDLKILSARNVQSLHIERDETFLLSLTHAVQKAKAALV